MATRVPENWNSEFGLDRFAFGKSTSDRLDLFDTSYDMFVSQLQKVSLESLTRIRGWLTVSKVTEQAMAINQLWCES